MKFNQCSSTKAFSLVEMLVVIAVIGIIAAIAIPSISNIRESSQEGVARRNAQAAASISAAANADGAYHVIPDTTSVSGITTTLEILNQGVIGEFTGVTYQLPLSTDAITNAADYLNISFDGSDYVLIYRTAGS